MVTTGNFALAVFAPGLAEFRCGSFRCMGLLYGPVEFTDVEFVYGIVHLNGDCTSTINLAT